MTNDILLGLIGAALALFLIGLLFGQVRVGIGSGGLDRGRVLFCGALAGLLRALGAGWRLDRRGGLRYEGRGRERETKQEGCGAERQKRRRHEV